MEGVYIISNKSRMGMNPPEFKVGKHGGNQKKLLSRYKTPLTDPIICAFFVCEGAKGDSNHYASVEADLLRALDAYRILDSDGKKTEWVRIDLFAILSIAQTIPGVANAYKPRAMNAQINKPAQPLYEIPIIEQENAEKDILYKICFICHGKIAQTPRQRPYSEICHTCLRATIDQKTLAKYYLADNYAPARGTRLPLNSLYDDYVIWCMENALKMLPCAGFHGIASAQCKQSGGEYFDIKLKK